MKLYRYLRPDRFIRMIDSKMLYFANPFTDWKEEDDNEGYLYRYANEGKWSNILNNPRYDSVRKQLEMGCLHKEDGNKGMLDWFGMRCLCWCKTKCSHQMFEKYGDVCFEIESADLLNLKYENHKVEGFDVEYIEKYDVGKIEESIGFMGEFYFTMVMRYKNKDKYCFEDEYRSYITCINPGGHVSQNTNGVLVPIPIDNSNNCFIKKVYLNKSKDSNESEIKGICNKYGIPIQDV